MVSRIEQRAEAERLRGELLDLFVAGSDVRDALYTIGRSTFWYEEMRRQHKAWAALCTRALKGIAPDEPARLAAAGTFPEFCANYLHTRVFPHQQAWIDLIEGRTPEGLHSSMNLEPADPQLIMINVPPDHSKSTCISVNYVTYLLCTNPDARIVLVSKTLPMAQQFCYSIKTRLTSSYYSDLQAAFAPVGGFKAAADQWTTSTIYLGGDVRTGGEKDPNLRCIGIGQQVYGSRADFIILDDCVTLSNAHEFEKQVTWVQQEILSRPGDSGKVVIIGTRVAPQDLYGELRNPERYAEGKPPWTYLSMPAVLEFNENPDEWVTLWPKSDQPWPGRVDPPDTDGLYPRWDGKALHRKRGMVGARTWAFCYQQQNLSEDAVFPAELVRKAVNGMRSPGLMHRGGVGYRKDGMDGLYVVGGVDPAMAGDTAVVIIGMDRFTGIRHVLDARVKTAASPSWIRETIKTLTKELGVHEWVVEKNAFQIYLTQDPELHTFLANLGVTIREHFTGKNKWDAAFGVAAMSLLFQNNLIELPNTAKSEAIRQLVEQLITWGPDVGKYTKTDLVMALWFAEIKCREIMQAKNHGELVRGFLPNRFLTRARKAKQHVVNLTDLAIYEGTG